MIGRNAVALDPRADSRDGGGCQFGDFRRANGLYDVGVVSHSAVMHNALQNVKRHLHNESRYANSMSEASERLRVARIHAGFETAKEAAEAMGVPVPTYLGHENGSRGFPAKKALIYARKFKVREQWLLYGVGPAPGERGGEGAEVIDIFDRLPPIKRAEALGYLRGLANNKA